MKSETDVMETTSECVRPETAMGGTVYHVYELPFQAVGFSDIFSNVMRLALRCLSSEKKVSFAGDEQLS